MWCAAPPLRKYPAASRANPLSAQLTRSAPGQGIPGRNWVGHHRLGCSFAYKAASRKLVDDLSVSSGRRWPQSGVCGYVAEHWVRPGRMHWSSSPPCAPTPKEIDGAVTLEQLLFDSALIILTGALELPP